MLFLCKTLEKKDNNGELQDNYATDMANFDGFNY